MKNILTILGNAFIIIELLFTCNQTGFLFSSNEESEIMQKEVIISVEDDMPADLDVLADSIANDVREYHNIPDVVHLKYGKYGNAIETFDTLRWANLISSHNDTLFILPIDPGLLSNRTKIYIEDAIEIKLIEMAKK